MRVRIKYCRPCGYLRDAQRLAGRLQDQHGVAAELEPGFFGVFKIWVNDQLIFDKRTTRGWLGKIGFGKLPADDVLLQRILHAGNRHASP